MKKEVNKKNKILVILGMHRSGTSLTAQWILRSGLNLGDELMGADKSNKFGHVEDMDFVSIHRDMLKHNGYVYSSNIDRELEFTPYYHARGEAIVQFKNKLHHSWGWKDPRTCLFLNFWAEKIPEAKYFIVFRSPELVVDSLLRREYNSLRKIKILPLRWLRQLWFKFHIAEKYDIYLKSWIGHNQRILDFIRDKRLGEDFVLVRLRDLKDKANFLSKHISNSWKFDIETIPFSDVYEEKYLKKSIKYKVQKSRTLITESRKIEKALSLLAEKHFD